MNANAVPIPDCARQIGVSETSLRNWMKAGKVRACAKDPVGRPLFDAGQVLAAMDKQGLGRRKSMGGGIISRSPSDRLPPPSARSSRTKTLSSRPQSTRLFKPLATPLRASSSRQSRNPGETACSRGSSWRSFSRSRRAWIQKLPRTRRSSL